MITSNFRRTRLKGWFEYSRETCPICNKSGGCMINETGETVVCIRIESKVQFSKKFTSWVHKLKENKRITPIKKSDYEHIQGNKKVSDEQLHEVYSSFLANLHLSDAHYSHLTNDQRQMDRREISFRQYATFPEKPWLTVKQMNQGVPVEKLSGVPGFYENDFGWSLAGRGGVLIPYRSTRNHIIGFQTRADIVPNEVEVNPSLLDGLQARVIKQPNFVQILVDGEIIEELELTKGETHSAIYESKIGFVTLKSGQRYHWLSSANRKNGTGAGSPLPIHVALPTNELQHWRSGQLHKTDSVWVTEGALKADIAAEHIEKVYSSEELKDVGSTILAVAGANTWRTIMPALEEMGVKHVNIAFDMDAMSNPYVANYLKEFAIELKNRGYTANIAVWNINDGKGIDDVFINRRYPQLRNLF